MCYSTIMIHRILSVVKVVENEGESESMQDMCKVFKYELTRIFARLPSLVFINQSGVVTFKNFDISRHDYFTNSSTGTFKTFAIRSMVARVGFFFPCSRLLRYPTSICNFLHNSPCVIFWARRILRMFSPSRFDENGDRDNKTEDLVL